MFLQPEIIKNKIQTAKVIDIRALIKWTAKGYNDIPRSESKPRWYEAFVYSSRPFRSHCLQWETNGQSHTFNLHVIGKQYLKFITFLWKFWRQPNLYSKCQLVCLKSKVKVFVYRWRRQQQRRRWDHDNSSLNIYVPANKNKQSPSIRMDIYTLTSHFTHFLQHDWLKIPTF